jgi:heme-degrading monooxygenase HmoA
MYARNVSFGLKPNMQAEFTRTFENQILPLLRKQKGFKEEITLCSSGSVDAVCISLWESKTDADHYTNNAYPEVLKTLAKVIDGTPRILTYDRVVSTFHVVPAAV